MLVLGVNVAKPFPYRRYLIRPRCHPPIYDELRLALRPHRPPLVRLGPGRPGSGSDFRQAGTGHEGAVHGDRLPARPPGHHGSGQGQLGQVEGSGLLVNAQGHGMVTQLSQKSEGDVRLGLREGYGRATPHASTATVSPPADSAARCAAASMPNAPPDTTVHARSARPYDSSVATWVP